jgi:hypothetical protein
LRIGWIDSPKQWDRWPEAEALLEPARARADNLPEILGPHDVLWVVIDSGDLLAAATTVLFTDGNFEVTLVGGRDHRRWLASLNRMLGAVAKEAGASRMTAIGRRGWLKSLQRLGWAKLGEADAKTFLYSRGV